MSSEDRTGTVSVFSTSKFVHSPIDFAANNRQPLVHIERRAHAVQRQPKLDERDRHCRLHADDNRNRVENARDRGDIVQHPADERVDDFQRRYIDHDAARARRDDLLRQILLQRHRHSIVHIHLDRDEEAVADPHDRDFAHYDYSCGTAAGAGRLTTLLPSRRSAKPKASAIVAFDTTPSSRPRWTIVCAIAGRMPLRMQSAPISRAAEIVLIRCCATSVSTVGTPVMSIIAISALEATICSNRLCMTICVRSLSSVPISGSAKIPSQSRTTGVDSSSSSSCWRMMTSSRRRWC